MSLLAPPREHARSDEAAQALIREARRRGRRRAIARTIIGAILLLGTVTGILALFAALRSDSYLPGSRPSGASATRSTLVATCLGRAVRQPGTLMISCADANAGLTHIRWTSWGATAARGTATFDLNPCTPYCAASRIHHYRNATVVLSDPVHVRRGGFFTRLVVTYVRSGEKKTFAFSWKGVAGL